jgi:hypothetical protein
VYHNLLAALEAAHICRNVDLTFDIQQQAAKALANRDVAIRVLSEHESVHSKEKLRAAKARAQLLALPDDQIGLRVPGELHSLDGYPENESEQYFGRASANLGRYIR